MNSDERNEPVLAPSELEFLQSVFNEISAEPWFTEDKRRAEQFASRLVTFYQQLSPILPDRFADFARLHAKRNFHRKVRFEEDIARFDH